MVACYCYQYLFTIVRLEFELLRALERVQLCVALQGSDQGTVSILEASIRIVCDDGGRNVVCIYWVQRRTRCAVVKAHNMGAFAVCSSAFQQYCRSSCSVHPLEKENMCGCSLGAAVFETARDRFSW